MPFLSSKQQLPEYCTNCILSMSYRNAVENEELFMFCRVRWPNGTKHEQYFILHVVHIFNSFLPEHLVCLYFSHYFIVFELYPISYVRFYDLRELFSYIEDARQDIWKPRDSVRFIAVVTRCDLFSWSRTTLTRMSSSWRRVVWLNRSQSAWRQTQRPKRSSLTGSLTSSDRGKVSSGNCLTNSPAVRYNKHRRTSAHCKYLHCVSKTHQLWNGIARNYKDQFWWHLAEIFKQNTLE